MVEFWDELNQLQMKTVEKIPWDPVSAMKSLELDPQAWTSDPVFWAILVLGTGAWGPDAAVELAIKSSDPLRVFGWFKNTDKANIASKSTVATQSYFKRGSELWDLNCQAWMYALARKGNLAFKLGPNRYGDNNVDAVIWMPGKCSDWTNGPYNFWGQL